ncbi:MAG: acyltransferase [Wenzhouxiangella sp.]
MIRRLVSGLRVLGATLLLTLNTLLHIGPLLFVALLKALLRLDQARGLFDRWLMAIAASWIGINSWMIDHLTGLQLHVDGLPEPMLDGHFMVLCNHQSWVDIPVLQKVLNRRLPFLRFFLKSQLIWVPLLGLAWWAMDFPFMKRYSREQIRRRPELEGRDVAATRRFCEKFRHIPVAVGNFVEGTRFTAAKHAAQSSPYRHLLKPRAGGTAFVLDAMGQNIDQLVDITIVYPHGRGELVDLFADRMPEVRVDIRLLPIPERFRGGDYAKDEAYRAEFQQWLNALWQRKDETIERMLRESSLPPG